MAFRSLRFLFKPSIRPPTAKERRSKAHGLSKRRAHAFPAYECKGKKRTKKTPKQNCFEAEGEGGTHERNARLRGEAGIVSGRHFVISIAVMIHRFRGNVDFAVQPDHNAVLHLGVFEYASFKG